MHGRNLGAKGGQLPDVDGVLVDEGMGRLVLLPEFGADADMSWGGVWWSLILVVKTLDSHYILYLAAQFRVPGPTCTPRAM